MACEERKRIELTQINRSEGSFAATIEADTKFNFRNAARSKVANVSVVPTAGTVVVVIVTAVHGSARTIIAVVSTVVTGVASVGAVVSVSVIDVSGDDTTLIIENGIICEIGGDTKDGVESISLNASLDGGSRGSGIQGISASVASGSVGLASVHELVAHGPGDNGDILSRTVGVGFWHPQN